MKERKDLWNDLKDIHSMIEGPWIILGDFNYILDVKESIGSPVREREIEDFRACMQHCELQDIKYSVNIFTWNNKQEGTARVFSKIDRGMLPGFLELVDETWKSDIQGTKMYKVSQKLKRVKAALVKMRKNGNANIEVKFRKAKDELDKLQTCLHSHPQDVNAREAEKEAREEYNSAQELYFSYLREWIGDPIKVPDAFLEYYENLLGTAATNKKTVDLAVVRSGPILTQDMADS
ncbi:uncharacterized protein LOC110692095 [Chenopodium quinoa]|uniref:uncharacterized protein LOC110692095 n=1 Tax=Chenopodium quinoa TaxID=63459 RepID=UPI000B789DBA|nr:uncharacterized protein LOC110692095 [Chenopodium quinoa]